MFDSRPVAGCDPNADPILTVREPHCGGAVLAENRYRGTLQFYPYIELDLDAEQAVVVELQHAPEVTRTSELYIYRLDAEHISCADGMDNDYDGFADCSDRDCRGTPSCPDTCPTFELGESLGPGVARGSYLNMPDLHPGCFNGSLEQGAPDVSLRWVAPVTGRFLIDTIGGDGEETLEVQRGSCDCGGEGASLVCSVWDDPSDEHFAYATFEATKGEELTFWLNGLQPDAAWQLNIALQPEP